MKKIFTLIAVALMAIGANAKTQLEIFGAWSDGILSGSTYTFNGNYQGAATQATNGGDWSAYEYVWIKYSGYSGLIWLAVDYDEWVEHQSWGDVWDSQHVAIESASGVIGLPIEKSKTFVKGSAETGGAHIGETYDKHVRQVVIQDRGQASAITIEEVWVGSEAEYLEATGYNTSVNHMLQVNNGTASNNDWDRQAICTLNTSMVVEKTYVVKATIMGDDATATSSFRLVPIFSTSTNRDQWGGSADVEYIEASGPMTSTFQEFTFEFKAGFTHDKLQFFIGKVGGAVYFDNVSCKEKGSDVEMIDNGDFEKPTITNWAVLTYNNQTMQHIEKALPNTTGVNSVTTAKTANSVRYNMAGQQVGAGYKGIVIENGKKIVIK